MPERSSQIAIVGSGPTSVYALKNLLQRPERLTIAVFEAGDVAGCGIPYSEHHNTVEMLANITSVEIPPVLTSLADWVRSADEKLLRRFGIERSGVSERDFYPRILIGAYYVDQLQKLLALGEASGHSVTVQTGARVLDIVPDTNGFTLSIAMGKGRTRRSFGTVILSTGHLTEFDKHTQQKRLFRSPYPARDLKVFPGEGALILGSSLSAIDAAVALASQHGSFHQEGTAQSYSLEPGKSLRLTMVSRKGIIPDADFFYPIPEEPLFIFTAARLAKLSQGEPTGLLSKATKLLKDQLVCDDPAFVEKLALKRFTPETFSKAYFALRQDRRGFAAIGRDLKQSQSDYQDRRISMWRYTLMRAHEVFSTLVPYLDRKDLDRFNRHLSAVFADAYGCVPHVSIKRLLALHRVGCLDVVALGETGTIHYGAGQFILRGVGSAKTFGTLIDARGQRAASIAQLGFKALDGVVEADDFLSRTDAETEIDQFRIPLTPGHRGDVFCLSIPIMMRRYPFAQGLVACSEAAEIVANSMTVKSG